LSSLRIEKDDHKSEQIEIAETEINHQYITLSGFYQDVRSAEHQSPKVD
jgi:hypothetical protein